MTATTWRWRDEEMTDEGFGGLVRHLRECVQCFGYRVTFVQGRPHILTPFGIYQPWSDNDGFVQFCAENSVVIAHDADDNAEILVNNGDLNDMVSYVMERLDADDMAYFKKKTKNALDIEDIDSVDNEHLKAFILSGMSYSKRGDFMDMMSHSALDEASSVADEPVAGEGYAPTVSTAAPEGTLVDEPEDKPAGTSWTTTLVMKMADTTIHKDITVPPTMSFSKFRKEVAEVFYKDLPEKKKTKDVMSGKDFILTVIGSGSIIDRGNTHIKKAMTDGCQVEVKLRGRGGVVNVRKNAVKGQKLLAKIQEKKHLLQELSSQVSAQTKALPPVQAVQKGVDDFMALFNDTSKSPDQALGIYFSAIFQYRRQDFDEMLDYLKSSGAGSSEVKLKAISLLFFCGRDLDTLRDEIAKVKVATDNALLLAFDSVVKHFDDNKKNILLLM